MFCLNIHVLNHLSVCLPYCLPAYLPVCLSVYMSVCLTVICSDKGLTQETSALKLFTVANFMFINSVDNSKLLCLTVCLPACLPNCLLVCLSVLPTVQLSLGSGTLNFLSLNFCISPLLLFLEFIFKCNTTIPLCLSPKTLWR